MKVYDIAIIGGGVIGLMTARELLSRGFSVAIVEKNDQLAREASLAGGGIISPLHPWRYSAEMLDLAAWSHHQYPTIAKQLGSATGIYVPISNTGLLIPNDEEAQAAMDCAFLDTKIISAEQVFQIEPGLAVQRQSVWVPAVHNIRNPALCRALAKQAQLEGAAIFLRSELVAVDQKHHYFELCANHSDQQIIKANKVVVCAGAWSSSVLKLFSDDIVKLVPEIFPVKGQMLAYKAKPGVLRSIVLEGHHYLIPRHDGIVVAGSTVEHVGYDKSLTDNAFSELKQFAERLLPALKYYPIISQWSGLRPGCHRDKPIITQVQQIEGLYLNIGHFRNGLLSAPASAQCIADMMTSSNSELNINAYSI